jgi:membrane dipeptidase
MNPHHSRRQFLKAAAALPLLGAGFNIHVRAADSALPFATDNTKINKARDAALAILKPTPKQLEHGLRLHAESLVFESYGFAPRCAVDGAAFAAEMSAGASEQELSDLREEMTMSRCATDAAERREFLEAFRAAGVTCIFQNAGEEGNDPLRLLKRLAHFTKTTDLLRGEIFKAVRADDVVAAKKDGRLCLCFTGNGVPLVQQWNSVRDELRHIRIFHELGIRMMHLTYNRRNPLGDGCGEPSDAGVSDFGRAAIAEMNRIGVIVDVAHSGWRTSLEAAKASSKPMVASHTVAAALNKHIRAKPDEVLRAVCDTGGLAGVCCISNFLGGSCDIAAMLDHLDYVVKKFGAEHAAIGTDIAYISRNDEAERAKIPKRESKTPAGLSAMRWEALWPPGSLGGGKPEAASGLSWTNWPLFTVGLHQRGHSDETIRKILGENVLRVVKANATG